MTNFVLITVDCLRPDALSAMPFVSRLAKEGTAYDGFYTPSPWTLGSLTSWYTGLFPSAHGIDNAPQDNLKVSSRLLLLSEMLQEAGYTTSLLSSNPYITRGLQRGVDNFIFIAGPDIVKTKADRLVCDEALAILRDCPEPYFMHIHFNEAHPPYEPYQEYLEMFVPEEVRDRIPELNQDYLYLTAVEQEDWVMPLLYRLYLGECAFVDSQIRRVYEAVGDDTNFIVSADHGIGFDEHGIVAMNFGLWEELIHIPLIWKGRAPARMGQTTEFAAKVLRLAGSTIPPQMSCQSSVAYAELKPPIILYDRMDRRYPNAKKKDLGRFGCKLEAAVIGDRKLLCIDGKTSLFLLEEDPGEQRPIFTDRSAHLDWARGLAYAQAKMFGVEPETTDDDEEVLRRLRDLGYVE